MTYREDPARFLKGRDDRVDVSKNYALPQDFLIESRSHAMTLKLRLHIPGEPQTVIPVDGEDWVLGRAEENDTTLAYPAISRRHACLKKMPSGQWMLEDLGGRDTTFLNGQPVTEPRHLVHGDVISLANVLLEVLVGQSDSELAPMREPIISETVVAHNVEDLKASWVGSIQPGSGKSHDVLENQRVARLSDLLDIAQSLNRTLSIDAVFAQVREVVFRHLAMVERLALLVDMSGEGDLELVNAATRHPTESAGQGEDSSWISQSICNRAFSDRVAIQTSDAASDARFLGAMSIAVQGIKIAFAVPLWDKEEVVGVLYADARFAASNKSGEKELSFFCALGNLVASSVQRWLMAEKLASEGQFRQRLERYHSPSVVRELLTREGVDTGLAPTDFDISVLFCDIVGFTSLSERLSPAKTAHMLNLFFGEMLQEIFERGGTLDKFIGDAIMAFFGAPEPQMDHAQRSVAAARGILNRLQRLNSIDTFPEKLNIRIGINSGRAVVGDVGSPQRVDYTALGSTINLASRLEGLCPRGECIISESTYQLLKKDPENWEDFGEHDLKGISKPVRVYRMRSSGS